MKCLFPPLRFLPVLLLFVWALGARVAAAGFQLEPAAREKIEAEAQRLVDEQQTPGLAIGIMSGGQIVYAKGFGLANLETGTRVTPDSVFAISSNTKQFTAAAILLLVEQGKLRLEDPLAKFFPDFPRGREVTLRHLLTHSSGIHPVMVPGGLPTPEQRVKLRSAADLVPIIQGQANLYDFDPGTGRRYSNSGYILLGVIIEKVSGLSLAEFFKGQLFDRAGMTATALDDASEVVPNRASGYNRAAGRSGFIHPPRLSEVATGGGGIRSTVGDLLRWQEALLAGRIVSSESVTLMSMPGENFGMIVSEQQGHAVFSTSGGGPGFRSTVKIFPDDRVAIVVMANSGASQAPRVAEPGVVGAGDEPAPRKMGPGKTTPTKKGPGKKGPGKKTGEGDGSAEAPNPVRHMEQLLTRLVLGGQGAKEEREER